MKTPRRIKASEQAHAELRNSELKFRTLFEHANDAIFLMEEDRFIDCNRKTLEMFGCTKEQIIGQPPYKFSPAKQPDGQDSTKKAISKIKAALKGEPQFFEWKHCRYDGTPFDAEVSLQFIDLSGKRFLQAMVRDVSERKWMEEALKESEKKYKQVVENASEIIHITDTRGNFTFANSAALRAAGTSLEEFKRLNFRDIIHPEHRQWLSDIYIDQFRQKIPTIYVEFPILSRAGEVIWLGQNSSLMFEGDKIIGYHSVARDITEHKRMEQALKKGEEEARQQAQENAVMAEIGRIVSSTLDIEETYERFAEEVRKIISFDEITVGIINYEDNTINFRYSRGIDVPGRRSGDTMPLMAGTVTAEIIQTRSSLLVHGESPAEVADKFPGLTPFIQVGLQSFLLVPLFSGDQVIGVLGFSSKKPNAYSTKDVSLAERVANQIAGAIANAQLFTERKQTEEALQRSEEEARRLAQENAVMAEIGRIISSTLDIEEVYERFAQEMRNLIPFDRVAVNIINPEDYTFRICDVSGLQVNQRKVGDIIPLAGTGTEEVWRTRASILMREENREEILSRCPGLVPILKAGFRSIMTVPLFSKNEVIGVLYIQSTQADAYSESDLKLAERVGNQIAGAMANTLLFKEHKQSEEALRESEERYRNILESIEDGYYEVDIAGNFTFVNDSLCRILGYSKEETIGMNDRRYTDPENAKKLFQTFNKVYRTGQPARVFDWEIIRKDGAKRYVEASVSLIKDSSGNRIGFRGIVRDTTERKEAEEEMKALQEQLRQSQKIEAIGQLAGGIAHDFNNALTLIKTSAQLALLELKAEDPMRRTFEMIDKATTQSANLTRQLLAFSRRQIMEMKVIELNVLLRDTDKMLRRLIGEDIELVSVLAEDLGRVKVDPGQMEQVILNLAINSRDAMPRGGKLTIETANVEIDEKYVHNHVGAKPGRYVRVSVSDTGVGMTPEVKGRIFEPFFTTKEKGMGTGLGLSTVYGIVKQSGGNVWVYSELGKGATFKVYLPRVDEALEEEREKQIKRDLPRGGETVLVAEDEGDVRNLVVQILKRQGYKVLEAANGWEALILCEKNQGMIHLLVTDVVMPVMSGRELTERLLLLHPEAKVLYMSGYTDDAVVRHGILEEGVNFIQKPFSLEKLVEKVREVLDKNR
ncbi:MAG: PAS domain S-box protein [Thermodesulfobacteriota bacterium]|nr:PAS domain S-box protein [Thermodesulfobacteriota bacterium]